MLLKFSVGLNGTNGLNGADWSHSIKAHGQLKTRASNASFLIKSALCHREPTNLNKIVGIVVCFC